MIRLAAVLPATLIQSMGAVITMEDFKLDPQENGLLMAVMGAAAAVCIDITVKPLLNGYLLSHHPLLSAHPLLSSQLSESQNYCQYNTVNRTPINKAATSIEMATATFLPPDEGFFIVSPLLSSHQVEKVCDF